MKSHNVIRDGQTRRGRIDPVERLHDALEFEYRPMVGAERGEVADSMSGASAADCFLLICDAIAKHLVSWSEVDDKDQPVPATLANVSQLSEMLGYKLYAIIAGSEPSARLPDATPNEQAERLADLRRRAAGATPDEAEEAALGNSATG